MSNPCTASTCLNGNCPGCRNGVQFCSDPRCYPNCPNCNVSTTSNTNWIILTIILVLLGVLLVLAFIIGYDWYNKGKKASEPKNLTINKHVHNVKPRSVVVNSPVISSPSRTKNISSMSLPISTNSTTSPISTSLPKSSITTEGINLSMEGLPPKYSKIQAFE
jgi:hypothetical protein